MAGVALGGVSAHVASIEITHHLWIEWSRIAVKHLRGARAARLRLLARKDAAGNRAEVMQDEYSDSLVTISASAHALDAAYGALQPLVTMPQLGNDAARHDHIRSALAAGYRLGNDLGRRWNKEFSWLFGLRDAAVHHREVSRPTVPHPIEGHGSYEAARYCLETSERAIALLLDVLKVMGSVRSARNEDVRNTASGWCPTVADIVARAPLTIDQSSGDAVPVVAFTGAEAPPRIAVAATCAACSSIPGITCT